ncbi:DUF3369 domain-containing protein [Ruminococcaceae bacterium OttesenSCG-928-L11]|nr:DUF3369 domain-containing protein [Ruminococcaceae bacterium OttesenSCG-928-L11]
MRRVSVEPKPKYRILAVDDEIGVIDSLSVVFKRFGYAIIGTTDPLEAVERVRTEHFDLLILDYMMSPIHGDQVVERIREFDRELYILLLTGYKDLAPPLETIKTLDIQGYCEKSDRFDQLVLLVESGIKSISQMNTIRKFKDGLNKILQSVPKIYQLQPIGNILEEILVELLPFINSNSAFIIIDDLRSGEGQARKSIFRGIGRYASEIGDFMDMLSPELLEQIGTARTMHQNVRMESGLILPLGRENGGNIGVLYVEFQGGDIEDGRELIEIYANQASASLNNAFLHSMINTKNAELSKTYDLLRRRYMDTIEALRIVVDTKDVYTRGHSDRVSFYAVKIGEQLGLSDEELETLRIGSLFHDIGKIGTADDILLKTESLNREEYEEIKKHPLKGAHILSAVSMFQDIVPLVKCHHERLDGTGYPEGLTGDAIPFLAKIISVADAFDAMTSDRTYRFKMQLDEAVKQLKRGAGTQFEPEIVDAFVAILHNYDELHSEFERLVSTSLVLPDPMGQMLIHGVR